jgi:hypothetical protein
VDEEDHEYATALSGLLSRTIGGRAVFCVFCVHRTIGRLEQIDHGHDVPGCLDAATVGIVSNSLWTPRASGFRPGVSLKTFGIKKRLRGHVCQLNVSRSPAGNV